MNHLYFVESKIRAASLYQLKDGRFQLIQHENLSPYMQGVDYVLVENKLADFLQTLHIPLIEFKDAVVWDPKISREHNDYKQLFVRRYFTEKDFSNLDLRGLQMYSYEFNYLFVSSKLKKLLETSNFDYLLFSKGFSRFA